LVTKLYGILLIACLVAVSGVIAYVGDIVGRRMGRKRLSLFGMRPRHTAIAISVISGMLITLFVLAVAALVSKDVKDGLFRVVEMRVAQAKLAREIKNLTRRADAVDRERKAAEQQVKQTKTELEQTETHLAKTTEELGQVQQKLESTRTQLAKTAAGLKAKEREVKNAERLFGALQRALEADAERARISIAVGRSVPLLFGAGQILHVDLIQGGQSVSAVRKQLDAMLARLDQEVQAAGARPLPEAKSAVVVQHPVVDRDKKVVAYFYGEQVLSALADQIHGASGGVIVRVDSLYNSHQGEPAYVDFALFNNKKVYDRGQILAETIVDGRLSEAGVYVALVSLLRDEVGSRARRENVMARPAPLGGETFGSVREPVGDIGPEELFASIAELRRINGPARVRALAAEDTWTAGPLEVEFRIEPVTAGGGS
jgi:uncharacterized protein (DUF3084 family)